MNKPITSITIEFDGKYEVEICRYGKPYHTHRTYKPTRSSFRRLDHVLMISRGLSVEVELYEKWVRIDYTW